MTGECNHEICEKVRQLMSEYLDHELRGAILEEIRLHIARCPDCELEIDTVKKTIRLYREAPQADVPVDIRIRLQDVIRRAREQG